MNILSNTDNSNIRILRVAIGIIFLYQFFYLLYTICYLDKYGRLPLPYYDDSSDSFMDFYNVLYYSINKDLLVEWKSIYPSFVFMVTNLIFDGSFLGCSDAICIRDASPNLICFLIFSYGAALFFLCCKYRMNSRFYPFSDFKYAPVLSLFLFFFFSYPSIFAIDRGNYFLIFFIFYSLYFIYIKNIKTSSIFYIFSVLFKPYAVLFLPLFFKNNGLIKSLFLVVAILFMIMGADLIFPYGSPLELASNISNFAFADPRSLYEILLSATSFFAYIKLIHNSNVYNLLGIENFAFLAPFFSSIILILVISWFVFCASFLLKYFDRVSSEQLAIFIALNLLFFVDGTGLYALIMLIPPFLYWVCGLKEPSTYSLVFIVLLLALFLPFGIGVGPERSIQGISFYGQGYYTSGYKIPLISLIRPAIIFLAILVFYRYLKDEILFRNKISNH